jgi:hypothetical protein
MTKKQKALDLTRNSPLVDRQRNLWGHSEVIELAQKRGEPLPEEFAKWLHVALKNIACGQDANAVFNVVPEKRGVRKDGFLREMQGKMVNGHIAAATEKTADGIVPQKTKEAIQKISKSFPETQPATVRKNWNKLSTDRKPEFSLGKK